MGVVTVVLLDANELQRDWLCTGLKYQLLRHNAFHPPMQFSTSAAVLEELVANHAREVESAITATTNNEKRLRRLGVLRIEAELDEHFDYRSYLIERFNNVLGIDVLDWPDVSHSELVARAVSRTPPFDNKGSGYRDSLLWADAVNLARRGSHVALVSQDKVFADGHELTATLRDEVADLPGSVELVRDFSAWLLDHLPWPVDDLESAVHHSQDEAIYQWFMQSDFQSDLEPEPEDLGFQTPPFKLEITEVSWDGRFERVDARISPDGLQLVEYDIGQTIEFEAVVDSQASLEDHWTISMQAIPGYLTVQGHVSMFARVGVLFDDDLWSADQLTWRRADDHPEGAGRFENHPNQIAFFDL